jgi:hypothetical protein
MKLKNLFESDRSLPGLPQPEEEEFCCGKHAECKKLSLVRPLQKAIEYYDDEELDVFKNRTPDSYTDHEVEQFAEVLHTMWETDIPGWLISLQHRNIKPPEQLTMNNEQ